MTRTVSTHGHQAVLTRISGERDIQLRDGAMPLCSLNNLNKKLNFRRCAPLDWCEPEHLAGPFHWSDSEHFLNILNILNVFRFYESVAALRIV